MERNQARRPPLDKDRLLTLVPPWAQLEVLEQTGSTNQMVSALAREGAPHGLVVASESQSHGRGRLDRSWESPASAGLTFSMLMRLPKAAPDQWWGWLPLAAGVGLVEGIVAAGGPRCVLKWPNDVMYDGLKLAGVLCERVESPLGSAAIVGIGLNVTTTRSELPVPHASSLSLVGWTGVDRTALFAAVLRTLGERFGLDHQTRSQARLDVDSLKAAFQARCETLSSRVRVELPTQEGLIGQAEGIDDDGALLVREGHPPHAVHRVSAGDVVHVRTAME